VEAPWALTSFQVFDSIRRHASFDEVVQMITGMAVTVVDPEEIWKISQRGHEDEAP
jgi:hypothetical protein